MKKGAWRDFSSSTCVEMSMEEEVFKFKVPDFQKLEAFGFQKQGAVYIYETFLMDRQFCLSVSVSDKVKTTLTDTDIGEPYILHKIPSVKGAFVGKIRKAYLSVLEDISKACFDTCVFKCLQTKQVVRYIKDTYGDELEFLWKSAPDNAIVRRKDNRKWYGAFLTVKGSKIGLDTDKEVEIIDLRGQPEHIEKEVDNACYFAGFHMNKKHWYTVCLDGRVSTDEIYKRVDESYRLARKSS